MKNSLNRQSIKAWPNDGANAKLQNKEIWYWCKRDLRIEANLQAYGVEVAWFPKGKFGELSCDLVEKPVLKVSTVLPVS